MDPIIAVTDPATWLRACEDVEPEKGASAVVELAHHLIAIGRLARPDHGTTINAGVIAGGTRGNVVAEHAWAALDVRITAMDEATRIGQALTHLVPSTLAPPCASRSGRPAAPRTVTGRTASLRSSGRHRACLGYPLPAGSVGGASDGNFTAALGIPTIDGLGAVGGAHARHELVRIEALPLRAAPVLAGLIDRLSRPASN